MRKLEVFLQHQTSPPLICAPPLKNKRHAILKRFEINNFISKGIKDERQCCYYPVWTSKEIQDEQQRKLNACSVFSLI